MAKLKYTLKRDTMFKTLFARYPDLLKRLVAELLGIRFDSIGKFFVRNSETPPAVMGDKFCKLDIAMTVDGRRVNLEVQVEDEKDYRERSLHYWASDYSSSLPSGGKYSDLPPTILISIVAFRLFACKEFHSEFRLLEVKRHEVLTDKMCMHYFELKKLPEVVNADDKLKLWLSLFKADSDEELAKIQALGDPIMEQAIEAYRRVSVSDEFRELERMRERAKHNEASALANAEARGEAKGKKEGRKEGRMEGRMAGIRQTAIAMKDEGIAVNTIAKVTGLTTDEIISL
jgi:predicted transposase/invertase (TIGR01784 family)